jgi:D-glycero-D-manno-heptose 1,7-bisphosphate phosphatase
MSRLRPALLLDRDGVINIEKTYVHQVSDFEFVDGIFALCQQAVNAGMAIVVVTNQAGIGRGYYTEGQFALLTDWMRDRFSERGINIDAVYFCPYHPEHGIGPYRCESFDRKPNPGMILRAQADLGLDLKNSVLVGDKMSDIAAARAAGVGCTVLLDSAVVGHEAGSEPDIQADSLQEVRELLFGMSEPAY